MKQMDNSDIKEMAGFLMEKGYSFEELPDKSGDLYKKAKKHGYTEGEHFGAYSRKKEINKMIMRLSFIFLLVALFLMFNSCDGRQQDQFVPRAKNEFIHYSQVFLKEIIPEKEEYKYDSILWQKIPSLGIAGRGIIYQAEVSHQQNDTFWEASVVLGYDYLPRGSVITVMSEGVTVGGTADRLINSLECLRDSILSLFE